MKKLVYAGLLALTLTAVAGQEASANGGCRFCFGMTWSCWKDYCFPCVDPALFGLPNGAGYGGGYAGYGCPVYQAAPVYMSGPAYTGYPVQSAYMQPSYGFTNAYQSPGSYYPTSSFSGSWYGYGR